jgi:hypothetical protein
LFRYLIYALSLLIVLLALFGVAVDVLDLEPTAGTVIRLDWGPDRVPVRVVFGTWLLEAAGLAALYLLIQGRCGTWILDGLVAGWVAWIFRGPLLVVTLVVATRQPQGSWWSLVVGWWVLYSLCGLALAMLARRFLPEMRAAGRDGSDLPPGSSRDLSLP